MFSKHLNWISHPCSKFSMVSPLTQNKSPSLPQPTRSHIPLSSPVSFLSILSLAYSSSYTTWFLVLPQVSFTINHSLAYFTPASPGLFASNLWSKLLFNGIPPCYAYNLDHSFPRYQQGIIFLFLHTFPLIRETSSEHSIYKGIHIQLSSLLIYDSFFSLSFSISLSFSFLLALITK